MSPYKKINLLILLLCLYQLGFAQVLPKYAIVGNQFFKDSLASKLSFAYLYPHSSDSAYIRIFDNGIKYNEDILKNLQPIKFSQKINYQWQSKGAAYQNINISFFDYSTLNVVQSMFGIIDIQGILLSVRVPYLSVRASVREDEIVRLAAMEGVKFITFTPPAVREINFVERTNHRVSQFSPNFPATSYLTGRGISMGEWDGGDVGNHIDFDSRLTVVKKLGINSHATHVAGTMAGAGNLEPNARGMAPEAKIYSWDFNGDIAVEMDTNQKKYGYVLTQNSYGYWTNDCADFALYDATSTDFDHLSIKFPDLLHVYAAGNSRGMNCLAGGYKTILPGFQSAKNTISVAAISSTDGDSYFSCAGPTQDGRFKPEISAVGVNVYSTQNNNTYAGGWNGTSMATPGASGTIALLYERFKAKYGYIPKNYLGKNIISNTADDIGNVGPDYLFGFGRINGQAAVNLIDSGFWRIDSVANSGNYFDTIYLPGNLNELRAMLTWNDIEVNPSTNPILVNDLDLTITDSAGIVYSTWWCNPAIPSALAIRKRDSINNIEQVTIKNPLKGRYIIKVSGKKIPFGKQAFAITWVKESKGLTVVYPNGKETIESPSSAAKSQLIRWDSKGVTGTYTLSFSRDSGASWQAIASNIPNTQNYYNWQTLADTVNTGRALIKISNGTVSDVSNDVFNITAPITGLTTLVCDSQVYLRWRLSPNAAFYRVFMLVNGKMQQMGTPTDTGFLIAKLNNGKPYWFAVSSSGKNGAESQRCVAISATPNNTNLPPRITIQPKDSSTCYSNIFYEKSKAIGTNPLTSLWEYSNNGGMTWSGISNFNDSVNFKLFVADFSYSVRRSYRNICLAPVYTRNAVIRLDSILNVQFFNKDTIVCKGSITLDSVKVISKIPSTISWYNDSLSYSLLLQKSTLPYFVNKINRPINLWAEIKNLCGSIKTKDLTKPAKTNGRNDYTLFPAPVITIKDTFIACVGETIKISPTLSGGRPGFQKLLFKTEDSAYLQNSLSKKITHNQTVTLYYFDNCYPDTTVKKVYIKMRDPLKVDLLNDSTICFGSQGALKAYASGGSGSYSYFWSDKGFAFKVRLVTLQQTKMFKVTVTDNCTEKPASDSVTINVLPALKFSLEVNNDTLCSGNVLKFKLTPQGGRLSTRVITWGDNNLSGDTPSIVPEKSTVYTVRLSDGCSLEAYDTIPIFLWDPLKIKIDPVDTLCNGKAVNLSAQYTGGLPSKQVIQWLPIAKTGQNVSYTPLVSQNIIALISDGCTTPGMSDTMKIYAYEPLQLIENNDTMTCYGKALPLTFNSAGGKTNSLKYYWGNEKTNVIWADSFQTKTYTCSLADGCNDSLSKTIHVIVTPKLNISPVLIKKCSYSDLPVNFVVNSALPSNVTWDNLPGGKNQLFKDTKSANYMATISDGCSDTSMVNVQMIVSDFSANNFDIEQVILKTVDLKADKNSYKNFINWGDGFQTVENEPKAMHNYQNYGKFSICKIQQDDIFCSDTICKTIDNSDPAKFKDYKISIYPNPVKDELHFAMNQLSGEIFVQITDATGKNIFQDDLVYPPFKDYNIHLAGIASGVYTLKVICNGELFTAKFVKVE